MGVLNEAEAPRVEAAATAVGRSVEPTHGRRERSEPPGAVPSVAQLFRSVL
jgi:hypothetical protein